MNRLALRRSGVVLSAVVMIGACTGTGATDDLTSTSAGISPPTESATVPTSSTVTSLPSATSPSEPEAQPLPTNATDYATAAFEAWRAEDEDMLTRLLTGDSLEALRNITVDPGADWEFERCEGAAGSSYCRWMGPDGSLSFRVGSEAVSAGEEQAITEVLVAGG